MKIYEDRSYAQEFDVTYFLALNDDGQFTYAESYLSYGGGFDGEVLGSWRQSGDAIFLRVEQVSEGINRYTWLEGEERSAIVREEGESIIFEDGFTLRLRHDEPVQPAAPLPVNVEKIAPLPDTAGKEESQLPTVARLHFKDGSTQERRLPNDPLFGLFDKMFYRLVDDDGNVTNVFELRQTAANSGSPVAEYDEIDFIQSIKPTEV